MSSNRKGVIETMKSHGQLTCIVVFQLFSKISYYSFQLMLFLFLLKEMHYSQANSIGVYHLFVGLGYVMTIVFSTLSDIFLPKLFAILMLAFLGIIGQTLIVAASYTTTPDGLDAMPGTGHLFLFPGLLLQAVGMCGIREMVSSLGSEQLMVPRDQQDLYNFYKLFFFSATTGAVLSSSLVPQIRSNVSCFGVHYCFPLALLVPAVLIVIGILVLGSGFNKYVRRKPPGSVTLKCLQYMMSGKSGGKFTDEFIADYAAASRVLPLFIPLPIFWSLLEQMGSRWTYQAYRMDGRFARGSLIHIEPDQMQIFNPVTILLGIPLMDFIVYPLMNLCRLTSPPQRGVIGGLLAILAFILAALIELAIENSHSSYEHAASMGNTTGTGNTTDIEYTYSNVHMTLQIPQYLLISLAQFLYPLALLEFTYTQIPKSMKQWVISWWLFTIALGNFFAMVSGFGDVIFHRQFWIYVIFAGLMTFDTILIVIVAYCYKTIYEENRSTPN